MRNVVKPKAAGALCNIIARKTITEMEVMTQFT